MHCCMLLDALGQHCPCMPLTLRIANACLWDAELPCCVAVAAVYFKHAVNTQYSYWCGSFAWASPLNLFQLMHCSHRANFHGVVYIHCHSGARQPQYKWLLTDHFGLFSVRLAWRQLTESVGAPCRDLNLTSSRSVMTTSIIIEL